MQSIAIAALLAGVGVYALPQDGASCVTVTTEVIIPTYTDSYTTTPVSTITATTPKDLGTFTFLTIESSTKTLATLTTTTTDCTASGTVYKESHHTVYTTSGKSPTGYSRRALGLSPRATPCTTTTTFTTTYGGTYTFIEATGVTSTYTDYTAYSQITVTSTRSGGSAYAIATATATTEGVCGSTVTCTATASSTVTQDARCAPTALVSASNGFGLEYASDTPTGGAAFVTTADDASQCCQLCAEADRCAASLWDVRTGKCTLEFPVDFDSGELNCGEGALVYYDAGPNHPMAPGSGLFVGTLCGNVGYGSAKPDDGT
ncbi:hypothetical protein LTR78_001671 [Recurvomyces mirabilis]|uniref:Apple domain-containing protein n=1 Tax=Recurvomyces mirabilis TaxID=574656 RepID=A0AAE0WV35_9PEZI|nr:hypothetical protein LTR78_001671 [Recurvomyces mirabilis]KAK5151759.1 hypothetical protein LTS14_008891 [Recurvomyces mirabilis]